MTPSFGTPLQNNKYILQEEIKRGISGVTYKAFNTATKQEVTIKTLNLAIGQDSYLEELRKKSFDEARRLVRCSHPNIIRFRDFFIEEEMPYIVMDAIRGVTLDRIVFPNNPLPEDVAVNCMRQIGEAVKVIHASGLLHRDIRPENIMLREGGQQVVLIDFGIAREFKAGSVQTHTHITSDYAPLEQHLPRAKRSQATDVYGLAATLYTLLLAKVPVSATLRDRIPLSAPRDLREDLSPEVSVAVMKGMILEAEDRPSNVDEWLAMLPPIQNKNFIIDIPEGLIEPEQSPEIDPEPDRIPSEVKTSNSNLSQYIKIALALIAGFVIFDYAIIKFRPKNPQPEQTPNSEIVPIQTQFKV
ncbi:MAG: serine/threonine-protein kinase [Prochloraceae cyanobacterium]|nr:serine/threonine-protein kinase [Prochloraceae cyanobacterium]